jgi:hypothetical protein
MPSETSCDLTVFSTPCPWHQHGVLRWRLGSSRRASDRLLTDYLPGGKSDANTARRAKDPGKVFGAALARGLCQNSRRLWRVGVRRALPGKSVGEELINRTAVEDSE